MIVHPLSSVQSACFACAVCVFKLHHIVGRPEVRTTCQLSGQPHWHVIFQSDCALEPSCSIKTVSPCTVMCTVNSLPQGQLVTSWKFSGKWLWQLTGYPPQLHAVYRTRTAVRRNTASDASAIYYIHIHHLLSFSLSFSFSFSLPVSFSSCILLSLSFLAVSEQPIAVPMRRMRWKRP